MSRGMNCRHPCAWLLTPAATLALATGCSVEHEPDGEFVATRTIRGTISYRYDIRTPPATRTPGTTTPMPADDWLGVVRASARYRQQQNDLAYQDARRERAARFRQEQREIEAHQVARQQFVREQRWQEQGRERAFREQESRRSELQRQSAQAESARWSELSRPYEPIPPQIPRQESPLLQDWQGRALRLGQ